MRDGNPTPRTVHIAAPREICGPPAYFSRTDGDLVDLFSQKNGRVRKKSAYIHASDRMTHLLEFL